MHACQMCAALTTSYPAQKIKADVDKSMQKPASWESSRTVAPPLVQGNQRRRHDEPPSRRTLPQDSNNQFHCRWNPHGSCQVHCAENHQGPPDVCVATIVCLPDPDPDSGNFCIPCTILSELPHRLPQKGFVTKIAT